MTECIVEMIDVVIYGGALQKIPNANKIGEEIIRCKDCVYSEETLSGINGYICVRINDPRCWLSVGAGGFCAWAERKEK